MIEKIERPGDGKSEDKKQHSIVIRERKEIEISGVVSVDSFDEEAITLRLEAGRLLIEGSGLHIGELSLENHRVTAEGEIISLLYTEREEKARGSFFRRK